MTQGTIRLYHNGVSLTSTTFTTGEYGSRSTFGNVCNQNKLTAGKSNSANPNGPSSYFSGLLDEARLYDRALSSGEISAMYYSQVGNYYATGVLQQRAQTTTVQDGLVARWSFDASTGTDDSGNGHDATIQ